jgi:hypothetical protein
MTAMLLLGHIVISASMSADFPMILHESALFSRGCTTTSLEVVPCQVTAKASAPQAPGYVPWFVPPQGLSGRNSGFDHGVGHPLMLLCHVKAPNYRKKKAFKDLAYYFEWPTR